MAVQILVQAIIVCDMHAVLVNKELKCTWLLCTITSANMYLHPAVWLSVIPSSFMACISIHKTHLL